jgi:hypothetical protein
VNSEWEKEKTTGHSSDVLWLIKAASFLTAWQQIISTFYVRRSMF